MPSSAAEERFFQFAIQWSSIALLYYDYLLTFPSEVAYIWKSDKIKLSTILYVLQRYALVANILYLLAISDKLGKEVRMVDYNDIRCDAWYKFIGVISVFGRASVILTFLLRTYAVCSQSKIVLVGLGAIGLACVILDGMHVPGLRCQGSSTNHLHITNSTLDTENTLLSILVCVFEASATLLTFLRSIQALRLGGGSIALKKHTLDYLILEQGVVYFGLVSVFTVGATVLNFKAAGGFYQRLLNAITLPLSGMLTARFILRLRAYSRNISPLPSGRGDPTVLSSSFSATYDVLHPAHSLVDEFGDDPVGLVSYIADSETAIPTARSTTNDEHGAVANFLGQVRRGLQRSDDEIELDTIGGVEVDSKSHTAGNSTAAGNSDAHSAESNAGAIVMGGKVPRE